MFRRASHAVFGCLTAICLFAARPAPAVGLAGSSPDPVPDPVLTFPQFAAGRPIRMVAYGDTRFANPAETSGTNPRVRAWLAQRIAAEHPDAILLTGDTPFHGSQTQDWDAFRKETASWRVVHALELPATGNHEVYGGPQQGISNYLKNFPEIQGHRYYAAILGSVEIVSLDCTQPVGPSSPQARWFAATLEQVSSKVDFLLILYHIPWVADRQSQILVNLPTNNALTLRRMLESRLPHLRARVLVLNGHIHNYERFQRKGVMYVITGGGGAEPYPVLYRGSGDLYRDPGFPVYHYLTLDMSGSRLRAVMWKIKDPGAAQLEVEAKDEFTLDAPPPARRKSHERAPRGRAQKSPVPHP